MRREQVDDLLSLVVQTQEEVERLRSVRGPEEGIVWQNCSQLALWQMYWPNASCKWRILSFLHSTQEGTSEMRQNGNSLFLGPPSP